MLLYLIHSYNVWFKKKTKPLTALEKNQLELEKSIDSLNLDQAEKSQLLQTSKDLVEHIKSLSKLELTDEIEELTVKLSEVEQGDLKKVLLEKQDLIFELMEELSVSKNAHLLLSERVEMLKLQEIQSNDSSLEIQDIQERLKQKNDINRIMKMLGQFDQ
jgi:hypothetical protein